MFPLTALVVASCLWSSHADLQHGDQTDDYITQTQPKVLKLMQQVLCRNFPDVPCAIIVKDAKLAALIGQSIKQIRSKLTPTYYRDKEEALYDRERPRVVKTRKKINYKKGNVSQRKLLSGNQRKLTKYFPHKLAFDESPVATDDNNNMLSNSEADALRRKNDFLWKMDYLKHGEPSFSEAVDSLKMSSNNKFNEINEEGKRKYVMKPNVLFRKRLQGDDYRSEE